MAAILEYKTPAIDGIAGSFSTSKSSDLFLWVGNVAEPGPEQLQQPQLRAGPVGTRHDGSFTSYPDAPSLHLDHLFVLEDDGRPLSFHPSKREAASVGVK